MSDVALAERIAIVESKVAAEERSWARRSSILGSALALLISILSGGYSRPALIPQTWLPAVQRLDNLLSRWPGWFGARCLIGLTPIHR